VLSGLFGGPGREARSRLSGMSRYCVPADLTKEPFLRGTALEAGVKPHELRRKCFRLLLPDVYCDASLEVTDELRLKAVLLAAPPHAVVTGLTAAWLYGVWQPLPGTEVPLHIATEHQSWRFHCSQLGPSRLRLAPDDVRELGGIRVTTPLRTCFGLLVRAELVEGVVHADAFRHASLCTAEDLREYAAARPRWPHVRKVRTAIELSHAGAESPMETRLRMVPVLGGLPEPYVNRPVPTRDGKSAGRPDNSYLSPDVGIEYDGKLYHSTDDQRDRDDVRENGLLVEGMPLLRYGAFAVYRQPDRIIGDIVALRPDFAPVRSHPVDQLIACGRWQPLDIYPDENGRPRGLFVPKR
jgi:hypothetical protein